MTPIGVATLIAETIRTEWTGPTVALEGERSSPAPVAPRIDLSTRFLPPTSQTLGTTGGRLIRQRGFLVALCRQPIAISDGIGAVLQLATDFRDLFHGRSIGTDPVTFEAASPGLLGVDGPWSLASVEIPFSYQEAF